MAYAPLERAELCQPRKIASIRSNHCDAESARTDSDERIVRETPSLNLLVIISGGETGEDLSGFYPVVEAGDDGAFGFAVIISQAFNHVPVSRASACVKFLEHYRAQPDVVPGDLLRGQIGVILEAKHSYVNRRIEENWLHLVV
jgi:hypothetical protein